jgi:hypothetical protein
MSSEWRKSSYSSQSGGACLEARTDADSVLVRDAANRGGATLSVNDAAWTVFLATIR